VTRVDTIIRQICVLTWSTAGAGALFATETVDVAVCNKRKLNLKDNEKLRCLENIFKFPTFVHELHAHGCHTATCQFHQALIGKLNISQLIQTFFHQARLVAQLHDTMWKKKRINIW
jgi:hypothetical protein